MSCESRPTRLHMPHHLKRFGLLAILVGGIASTVQGQEQAETPPARAAKAEPAQTEPAKAAEPAQPVEAPQPIGNNPLQKWIKNIFGRPNGRMLPRPNGPNEISPGPDAPRDHIDSLAPHDPQSTSRYHKATTLLQSGNWEQAIIVIQRLLDAPQATLQRTGNNWTSTQDDAGRLLNTMPAAVRERYETTYGGIARQRLRDAENSTGEASALAEISRRFLHTKAGQEATDRLATIHLDHGEFGLATRHFRRLLDCKAPLSRDAHWQLKAAFAAQQSGDVGSLADILKPLKDAANADAIKLGDQRVNAEEWLKSSASTIPSTLAPPLVTEWPVFLGTPRRTAVQAGGTPLLLPRWSRNLTDSQPILMKIQTLVESLRDQMAVALPVSFPIMLDGKIAVRTLRGIAVLDAESGKLLWETEEGISAEHILNGDLPVLTEGQRLWAPRMPGGVPALNTEAAERHPLTNLLFRNAVQGLITGDNSRLFAIDENALLSLRQPGQNWGFEPSRNDPYRRDWSSNRLVAYGLHNGRPLWEIGGTAMNESFDLPLAGTFFFGPPVIDRGTGFIVGESNGEIRVFAFSPVDGTVLWSQLLAYPDQTIEQDIGRRWFAAQIAVDQGILICPTTVGWLVAIDRTNHSILWASRYSQPSRGRRPRRGTSHLVQYAPLNRRWYPAAPMIAGNHALYTPQEEDKLLCFSVIDGTLQWQKPKNTSLYLAGIAEDLAILVGVNSVTGLQLSDGTTRWTLSIPAGQGPPAGRGIFVDKKFYLPLQSGQLWTVDTTDGSVTDRFRLPDTTQNLGNLALYRGLLLSINATRLTSFEQREAITEVIADRIQSNPQDAWASLRSAEIQILDGDLQSAHAALVQIPRHTIPPELDDRYRDAMRTCLTAIIRSDFGTHDAEAAQLAQFANTRQQQLELQQVLAERHFARQEYVQAWTIYWNLASRLAQPTLETSTTHPSKDAPPIDSGATLLIPRNDDPAVETNLSAWLSGALSDVWEVASAEQRVQMSQQIQEAAQQLEQLPPEDAREFVFLFGFHPAAESAIRRLADASLERKEFLSATRRLRQLTQSSDDATHQAAREQLARLLREYGDTEIAISAKDDKDNRADNPDTDPRPATASSTETAPPSASPTVPNGRFASLGWGELSWQIIRGGYDYSARQIQELKIHAPQTEFFKTHRAQFDAHTGRLTILNADDDSLYWTIPLRLGSADQRQSEIAIACPGHALIILRGNMLHALSFVDRKLLWTRAMNIGRQSDIDGFISEFRAPDQLVDISKWSNHSAGNPWHPPESTLNVATRRYLCFRERRQLSVVDASNGRLLWKHNHLPANTEIAGTDDIIYVRHPEGRGAFALRALDGQRIPIDNLDEQLSRTIAVDGRDLILLRRPFLGGLLPLGNKQITFERVDPVTGTVRWKSSHSSHAICTSNEPGSLIIADSDGTISSLNLSSGSLAALGKISKTEITSRSQIFVISDLDNTYIISNSRNAAVYSESMPSISVNGTVHAFERGTARPLWKREIDNQNLLVENFTHTPLMIFCVRAYLPAERHWSSTVLALDKQTGTPLVESTTPANSDFRSLTLNMADRSIELRTYNNRVRLAPVPPVAPAALPIPAPSDPATDPPTAPPAD